MRRPILVLTIALLLGGCGGAGDGSESAREPVSVRASSDDTTQTSDGTEDDAPPAAAESGVTPVNALSAPQGFGESAYNGPEAKGATLGYALSGTDPEAAMNSAPGADAEEIAAAGLESEAVVRFDRTDAEGREDAVVVTQATFVDAAAAAELFETYRERAAAKNEGYAEGPVEGAFEWENPAMVQIDPSGEQVGPTPFARGIALLRGDTIVVLDIFFADEAAADPAVTTSVLDQVLGA